jgi:hypothetical protein
MARSAWGASLPGRIAEETWSLKSKTVNSAGGSALSASKILSRVTRPPHGFAARKARKIAGSSPWSW